jgi:catechol 2,3-dioxygenase-like lactoylglutathione lyase family enzyme
MNLLNANPRGSGCASASGKLARTEPGQPEALAREVSLIGVARVEGRPSEVVALADDEAAQAQDALKHLGAVADGGQEAASKLALAEPEIRSQRRGALSWILEAHDRRLNGAIRRAGIHEPRRCRCEQVEHDVGIGPAVQLLARIEAQRGDRDPAIAKLRQRDSKRGSACAREEARAEDQLVGLGDRVPRPRVRPGDDGALASPPDEVRAAVGKHSDRARAASDPQAGERVTQTRRRWELPVGVRVRFVQDRCSVGLVVLIPMKIEFIASVAVIAADPPESRQLYVDVIGLPLEGQGDYHYSEKIGGSKHFGVWPLTDAAQACFGTSEWPADRPIPQASIEFEVADANAVTVAGEELRAAGTSCCTPRARSRGDRR